MNAQTIDDARLGRLAADWMTDAVAGTASDEHLDQILTATSRMRPAPRWLALLKEPPMRIQTQTRLVAGFPGRRPILVLTTVALLILALVAGIAWYAGSRQIRPAPPYGLARNGVVFTNNAAGDIISVEPGTGVQRTLFHGPNLCCANASPDGQRIAFIRVPPGGGDPITMTIATADGSIIREIPTGDLRGLHWSEWSPDGHRMLLTDDTGVIVLDLDTTTRTRIPNVHSADRASWIGSTGDILVSTQFSEGTFSVLRLDTAGNTKGGRTLSNAVGAPLLSPDGSRFVYFLWDASSGLSGLQGVLHVVDLQSFEDRRVSPVGAEFEWENPVWSPDGAHIASEQYLSGDRGYQIAVIRADGGPAVLAGPRKATGTGGAAIEWSPDGTSLLVTYREDNTTWLLPASGGDGRQVDWAVAEDFDWQRVGN